MADKTPEKAEVKKNREDDPRSRLEHENRSTRPGVEPAASRLLEPNQPISAPNQWIPPRTGNVDLDPLGGHGPMPDLRARGPLSPDGMLMDPRDLIPRQPYGSAPPEGVPPGARFDPYGPPGSGVVPGRGPRPGTFGEPDPDHFVPPGYMPPGSDMFEGPQGSSNIRGPKTPFGNRPLGGKGPPGPFS